MLGPDEAPELTDGVGAVLRYVDASTPGAGQWLTARWSPTWSWTGCGPGGCRGSSATRGRDRRPGRGAGPGRRRSGVRPGPARGDRRLHGHRPRQVHRRDRGLPGHPGPGAVHLLNGLYDAKLDGKPVVAIVGEDIAGPLGGATPGDRAEPGSSATCAPVRPVRPHRRPGAGPAGPGVPDRGGDPQPDLRGAAAAAADGGGPRPATAGRRGAAGDPPGEPPARVLPHERRPRRRRAGARRRPAGGDPGRPGRPRRGGGDHRARRPARRRAWRPRCSASRCSTSGCPSTPACSARSAPPPAAAADGRLRHAAADRHQRPVDRATSRCRGRRARCRSTSTGAGSAPATRSTCRWSATPPRRCARCWPGCRTGPTGTGGTAVEASVDRWREEAAGRRRRAGRADQPAARAAGAVARLPLAGAVAVDVGSVTYWYARHLQLPPGVTAAPLRHARRDGLRPAVRGRRQARRARPAGDRADRRRRDAAQRPRRADHRGPPLAGVADPRLVVLVLNNRDQSGMGGGRQPGEPARPGAAPTCRTPAGPGCSGCTASGWTARSWSARPGTRRSPPTGPPRARGGGRPGGAAVPAGAGLRRPARGLRPTARPPGGSGSMWS